MKRKTKLIEEAVVEGPKTLTFSIKYDIHIGMKKLNFTGGLYEDL